jgi:hypothetical protein
MANNQASLETNSFTKGMAKDPNETYIGEGVWTHARNLVNNSHDGQIGVVGNEPSNKFCIDLDFTLIGCIPLVDNRWALFSTDNINSEIGIFDEPTCTYTKLVTTTTCLNFNTKNLITGASRRTFDCSEKVYWSDGNNPDRVIDINNIPQVQICTDENGIQIMNPPGIWPPGSPTGCVTCSDIALLNCEQLRLAPLLTVPCLSLTKATGSGTLINGTYQVAVAYMINEIKVTDYLVTSNPVSIWSHSGVGGAINLSVSNTDPDFTEIEVVVISIVNSQTVAKQLGVYSTRQSVIYIDSLDPSLVTVPIANLPLITPAIEKSDGIYPLNNYLLRTGIYTKPDFNYQPQANRIISRWQSVQYPEDYYHKAGPNVGYMRDEVYSFFIRWVYNTGDRSASYHIPGRPLGYNGINDTNWQTENTATIESSPGTLLPDGGVVVTEGFMGYWESSEKYPDDNSLVWNQPNNTPAQYNLCGKNIRHHKFPDNALDSHFTNFTSGSNSIRVLGVTFENITAPLDINNNIITSIVGYEILRGSREGQKSIVAKGMVNNMKQYNILDAKNGNILGESLMQNYPYNDITTKDPFYDNVDYPKIDMIAHKTYASFHSPDTTFQNPYLGAFNLRIYGFLHGEMTGCYSAPYKHPEFKILGQKSTDVANGFALTISILNTVASVFGAPPPTLGATNDMPYSMTLGLEIGSSPEGPVGGTIYVARAATNVVMSVLYYGFIGTKANAQKIADLIRSLIGSEQYASQFNSHGYYNSFTPSTLTTISTSNYGFIKDNVQSFDGMPVNNLYRNPYVIMKLNSTLPNPGIADNSLNILGSNGDCVKARISSNYAAIKVDFPSQYGQIDSIRQIPISSCVYKITDNPILFGGDTYINRYTEKNNYLFFNDWLIDQPEDTVYNYLHYQNIIGTRFWVDNRKSYTEDDPNNNYDPVPNGPPNPLGSGGGSSSPYNGMMFIRPRLYYRLNQGNNDIGGDQPKESGKGWKVQPGNFYLFCNGVRDFFVESEVNVGYRDWDEEISKRFYDPYGFTDLQGMFRSDIIKFSSGFYKYDYSLSVSRMYNQFISWGQVLSRSFNPQVAATCYAYYPRRIQYSLPQQEELKRDNWQTFLVNNYKDMSDKITCVKPINKTGALIMLERQSPIQITGVDSLQTDTGVKVTLGDGGLFNQPLQSIVNSDQIYEYGSCQSRWGITSTPQGIFYVSQDQGKIFSFTGQLEEISRASMKWWFSRYLPLKLKTYFPNFNLDDNPVIGAGITTVYDNINEVVYFSKKDYIPKSSNILYSPTHGFYLRNPNGPVTLNANKSAKLTCPEGIYINGECQLVIDSTPSKSSTNYSLSNSFNVFNGMYGTALYDLGYTKNGVGTYTNIGMVNPFWINNVPQPTVAVANTSGKFSTGASTLMVGNYISITGTNTGTAGASFISEYTSGTTYKVSAVTGNSPNVTAFTLVTLSGEAIITTVGTLVGLTFNSLVGPVNKLIKTINTVPNNTITFNVYLNDVPVNKIYYVALCSNNSNYLTAPTNFRVTLNDNVLINPDFDAMVANNRLGIDVEDAFEVSNSYLHIYPIQITAPNNTLKLEGSNQGFGAMVIDNTQFEILQATSFDDLNVIFTTETKTQFTINQYTCTEGSDLVYTYGVQDPVCKLVETESLVYTTEEDELVLQQSRIPITLCDPSYFEDASWTISYDVKNKQWISFHDWHPSFMLPSKRHFLTAYNSCPVSNTSLWRHNDRWDSFCNFYNNYYPFEIEYGVSTGMTTTTLRSVEYYLEAYKYSTNGQDKFHVLDYNFDAAIVYNSEQISGLLNLNLKSKTNPFLYLNYPIASGFGYTDILFSKEEQKYRFDQFNDITANRGEFNNSENILITTLPNGYVWYVNPNSVNYFKPATERKKFRHNNSKVFLRKNPKTITTTRIIGRDDVKMIFKFINTKYQISQK